YLPFKQKRKTKAMIAKEAGLEPLANWIWATAQGEEPPGAMSLEEKAKQFVNGEKEIPDAATAIEKVTDILVEVLSLKPELRDFVRNQS
ncbi:RNA-binding transcriptional accessory protein, partial [Pseudomonas sp. FW305-20]